MDEPAALQGIDGYIYSPPAWRVCPTCKDVEHEKKPEPGNFPWCTHCENTKRIPIRYTPEQWQEAGGFLTDDTPVWVWLKTESKFAYGLYEWVLEMTDRTILIAIPGQDRPPEDWNG